VIWNPFRSKNSAGPSLPERCRSYLENGPPAHMTSYVPGSLAEVVVAHGAKELPLDPELREIGQIILNERTTIERESDLEVRAYLQSGIDLVDAVLRREM
jgi:hypothetical protein